MSRPESEPKRHAAGVFQGGAVAGDAVGLDGGVEVQRADEAEIRRRAVVQECEALAGLGDLAVRADDLCRAAQVVGVEVGGEDQAGSQGDLDLDTAAKFVATFDVVGVGAEEGLSKASGLRPCLKTAGRIEVEGYASKGNDPKGTVRVEDPADALGDGVGAQMVDGRAVVDVAGGEAHLALEINAP